MAELRQRPVLPRSDSQRKSKDGSAESSKDAEHDGISVLDIIRVLFTLVAVSCGLSYYMTSSESVLWEYRPWFTRWPVLVRYLRGPLYLTPSELSLYNGTDPSLPILLAINGTIFDVSGNPTIYGPGGSYNFFAGKDATRAFVTGCFHDDLTDDLSGVEEMFMPVDDDEGGTERKLTSGERKIRREQERRQAKALVRKQVAHWENFYRNHRKYFEAGKVLVNNEGGAERMDLKKKKRELCQAALQNRPKRGQNVNAKMGKIGKPGN